MAERENIRSRLKKHQLTQVWLINQLGLRGIVTDLRFWIIEQAAIDYVDLLAGFKSPTTDCNVGECRRFFRSQWFHSLCDLDPEQVINRLERKAKTMVMKYEVHKEHGSSRWYVTEVGCKEPIPGTYGTKKRALHTAAKMNGLDYKDYMRVRRRDGMNHD